jgi:hypothetical protein
LGGLLQPGNYPEDLESADDQVILTAVIRASLRQADPVEAHELRDRKYLHHPHFFDVAVVLAPVNFHPRSPAIRALDRPALHMTILTSLDRVVLWPDSEGLEVPATPLAWFLPRVETQTLVH